MQVLRDIARLWRADPTLEWVRARDVEATRRRLIVAAAISIIATPIFVLPARDDPLGMSNSAIGTGNLILCLLLSGTLFLLGLNVGRSQLLKRPALELVAWMIIVAIISALGSFLALHKTGVMMFSNLFVPSGDYILKQLADNRDKGSVVVWMGSLFTGLGLILSTRGLPIPSSGYVPFVVLSVFLFAFDDTTILLNKNAVAVLTVVGLLAISINRERYRIGMRDYQALMEAEEARKNQEGFLSSLLPGAMLEKVQRNERVADSFSNLTVLFADMVGFTELSRRVSPGHLVDVLNEIFEAGDDLAHELGIEKVKTIGDCYMAVAGGIMSPRRGSADAIRFAMRYLHKVEEVSRRLDIPLALRAGIHTGPAVGGIIGVSRPAYDYWGDTVNLASRLEGASAAGRILVSESTWLQTKRDFAFEDGRDVEVKGVGSVRCHFVELTLAAAENVLPLRPAASN